MATVNTVLGPIDAADLGFTLSHEHIATGSAGMHHTYPEFFDLEGTIEDAVIALTQAYAEGVRSYIDASTFDIGRDIEMMREVSRRSGVHIIPATGSHQAIPRVFRSASPDAIAPLYIREVEEGIEGTGVKAGIIKSASDRGGMTELEEVVLRAVARASKQSGAPVYTHTWSPDRVGEQQIRILDEEGVDLDRVYIGHSNDTRDIGYILGLLQKGVWWGKIVFQAVDTPVCRRGKSEPRLLKNCWTPDGATRSCLAMTTPCPEASLHRRCRTSVKAISQKVTVSSAGMCCRSSKSWEPLRQKSIR